MLFFKNSYNSDKSQIFKFVYVICVLSLFFATFAAFVPTVSANSEPVFNFFINYEKDGQNKSVWYTANASKPSDGLLSTLDIGHFGDDNVSIHLPYSISKSGGDISIEHIDNLFSSDSGNSWHVYHWNFTSKKWVLNDKPIDEYYPETTAFALKYGDSKTLPLSVEKVDTRWFFLSWYDDDATIGNAKWINGTGWDGASAFIAAAKKHDIPLLLNESTNQTPASLRGWIGHIYGRGDEQIDIPNSIWRFWVTSIYSNGVWSFSNFVCGNPQAQDTRYFGYINSISVHDIPITPDNPVRFGYTFEGYYLDSGFTRPYDISKLPTEEIDIYTKWSVNPEITISFDTEEGNMPAPQPIVARIGDYIILPEYSGTFDRASFYAWNTTILNPMTNEYIVRKPGTMLILDSDKDLTFTSLWDYGECWIEFDKNGENVEGRMHDQSIKYGKTSKLRALNYTREGYDFVEWNSKPDGSGDSYVNRGSYTATKDVTLYAQWKRIGGGDGNGGDGGNGGAVGPDPVLYTVSYYLGPDAVGNPPESSKVHAGGFVALPGIGPDVKCEGMKFAGWTDSIESKRYNVGNLYSIGTESVVFTAVWIPGDSEDDPDPTNPPVHPVDKPVLTYALGEGVLGTAPGQYTGSAGSKLLLRFVGDDVSKEGYVFVGWRNPYTKEIHKPLSVFTMPEHDITLTAEWAPKSDTVFFEVTYLSEDNKVLGTESVKSGESPKFVTEYYKRGYYLSGWKLNGKLISSDNFKVDSDVTLVSVMTKLPKINDDGNSPNIADVISFLQYVSGIGEFKDVSENEFIQKGFDFNGDGELNIVDVIVYLKNI